MMNDAQLSAFRTRMMKAAGYGYDVAKAELYLADLVEETGEKKTPAGCAKGSAAHLLALADKALEMRKGGKKPKKAAPAEEDAGEEAEEGYEDWLKADLQAEAEARGLETKSSMTKADLVELLYADDEAE